MERSNKNMPYLPLAFSAQQKFFKFGNQVKSTDSAVMQPNLLSYFLNLTSYQNNATSNIFMISVDFSDDFRLVLHESF